MFTNRYPALSVITAPHVVTVRGLQVSDRRLCCVQLLVTRARRIVSVTCHAIAHAGKSAVTTDPAVLFKNFTSNGSRCFSVRYIFLQWVRND